MHLRISWLWKSAGLALVGMLIAVGGAACGDGGDGKASAEEIAAVEDVINQLSNSTGENAEYVFGHVTDNFLESVFFSSREDCQANAADCIGEPSPAQTFLNTEIAGDTATSTVTLDFGTVEIGLVRQDDVWMADSLQATSDEVPEGAASVDLGLSEFAFTLDDADIPADGNFVFHATNNGAQAHEIIVAPIPADVPLEDTLEGIGEDQPPAGLKIFIRPGQELDMAFDAPLTPGRYALVCFFPDTSDPEGTPHAEKGMLGEFTIE